MNDHRLHDVANPAILEHLDELGVAVLLAIPFPITDVIVLGGVALLGSRGVLIQDAPVLQPLVGSLRLVNPDLVPVQVGNEFAAFLDGTPKGFCIVAKRRVEPAMRAGEGAEP